MNVMLVLLCALSAQAASAQATGTTGAQTYPAASNFIDSWYFDVDFGATPVSVTVSVNLTCTSTDGIQVVLHDVTSMSKATTNAAWSASRPGVNFAPTGPFPATTGVLGMYGAGAVPPFTASTVNLSGVCRFFFTVRCNTLPPLASNIITVVFSTNVGTNVTPAGGGFGASAGLFYDNWSTTTGTVGASSCTQRHYVNQVLGFHTHGSAADVVQYEMDVLFPAVAATTDVSLRALTQVGVVGQLICELYDMTAGGGSVIGTSITISTGVSDAKSITTQAMTGVRKFRVIVRSGTGFVATPAYLINFFVTFGSNCQLMTATSTAIAATPQVQLITPSPAAGALPAGATGTAYTAQNFAAMGGAGAPAPTTWTWSISSGALPGGLILTPVGAAATASITGTPTSAGTFNFTVRATNTATGFTAEWAQRAYSIVVTGAAGPLIVCAPTTVTIPTTVAGTAGAATTYTVTGSNLSPAAGNVTLILTGGPGIEYRNATAAGAFGTGNVVIAYTGSAFAAQSIEVRFAASATAGAKTGSIGHTGGTAAAVNVPLSGTVTAVGAPTIVCTPPTVVIPTSTTGTAGTAASYTVSGTSLTPAAGNITLVLTGAGIEYRNATAAGTFGTTNIVIAYTGGTLAAQTIEVRFAAAATVGAKTGSIGHTGGGATAVNVALSGTVNAVGGALTITPATLANGVVGTVYNGALTATGGTGPFTWSLSAGALPGGLTLNIASTAATTSITGTPTAVGTFNFTVRVQDSTTAFDTQNYVVTITAASTGGGIGGGGGGGGGCASDSNNTSWFLLAGLAGMLLVALRSRGRAA